MSFLNKIFGNKERDRLHNTMNTLRLTILKNQIPIVHELHSAGISDIRIQEFQAKKVIAKIIRETLSRVVPNLKCIDEDNQLKELFTETVNDIYDAIRINLRENGNEANNTDHTLGSITNMSGAEIKGILQTATEEELHEIFNEVTSFFKAVAEQRGECIPDEYLETVFIKFLAIYKTMGKVFYTEHLKEELNWYIEKGLREDYKKNMLLPEVSPVNIETELEEDATVGISQALLEKALAGDAEAQCRLGTIYSKNKDHQKAVEFFTKSASQGNAVAQGCLGVAYAEGLGVQQSYPKAFELASKSAEQGWREAQAYLATCYLEGKGVQQDYKKAAEWLTKAAKQGMAIAQTNLGAMYAQGLGVPQDTSKAAEWLMKAAKQGNMDAQFNLGVIYTKQKNYKKAFELYFPIADRGHANAQNMLGEMYFNGDWVSQDFEQAAAWFVKAAEQGHPLAIEGLQEIRRLNLL